MALMLKMNTSTLLLLTIIVVLLPVETYAFGAGDIPDFAYLNDKAFRHGDVESILETLVKSVGGGAASGGILGFAQSMINQASGGAKFTRSDIKKVYFGNWLRDYSQAMDIAGLSKLTADTLVLIVSVLGFMTFGFATEEFQVTADRLSVYLPVEHIDNPKGYAEKEGDARQFHPKLRPPVDNRELEIDERTGMKNYMATEGQGWDTSTAFIRRTFRACIENGRNAGGREGSELWEAYRLLGTGLHTLEDLLAHSNWCEIALRKMGHEEVFCHVGDNVYIETPNGRAPPLTTGTFGGADFIYSLMGEATDKISQASVTDLSQKMDQASQGDNSNVSNLKDILGKLPIGGGDKMDQGEEIHAQSKAYNFNPDNIAPTEVQQQLLTLLKWRDDVYREVLAKIEMVPGLSDLLDELTNALNAYVYTILSPYIAPILQQATGVLGDGSKAVIESGDQFEVFDNPEASDPTHSFLSKDHFDLILNEPAGKIAQIVVKHSVNLIVQAWADNSDADRVIDQILEAFHHPYYATGQSEIQNQMFEHMERWIGGLGHEEVRTIIQSLTKDNVRNGKNKRPGSENESHDEAGYGGHSHGNVSHRPAISGGYQGQQGQYGSRTQAPYGQDNYSGRQQQQQEYSSSNSYGSGQARYTQEDSSYPRNDDGLSGQDRQTYGETHREAEYGSRRFGNEYPSGRDTQTEYTSSHYGESNAYERNNEPRDTYGSSHGRTAHGELEQEYESRRHESHSQRGNDSSDTYGYSQGRTAHGEPERDEYGSRHSRRGGDDSGNVYSSNQGQVYGESEREEYEPKHHGSGRHRQDEDSYGSRHDEQPRYNEGGGYAPSYGQSSDMYSTEGGTGNDYGSSSYGGGGGSEETYGSSGNNRGDEYGSSNRYQGERSSGYGGRQSGYTPSYGGSEETFGAERLNLNEDEGGERRHHGRHQGRREYD